MLRVLITAVFVLLAGVASGESLGFASGKPEGGRRVALVIGADDYRAIRKLDNAVGDAQAVGDMLETLGFEVTLETNRDLRRTRRALEDFREDGAGADVALVYFAGHGVEIAGDNRLLPVDADAASLDALKASTLPLEEVRETVADVAKVGLVMLDACRNDPFGTGAEDSVKDRGSREAGRGAEAIAKDVVEQARPGLGRVGRAEGILFAFSAAPGETASDGADGHSPFAEALIKYLGTEGLEVRSALTLVQQEVYDQSLGKQLPYVESGLPRLFFAAETKDELPERERLLLAMADITPELRAEVELVAARADMPLAPLYGTLISADIGTLTPGERGRKLQEAADAFVKVRAEMRTLASDDPEVTRLRQEAEQQLTLGAFDTARVRLAEAAEIDGRSRQALKENFLKRTISEATTHYLAGGAARADLRYRLAIDDYEKAAALYAEIEGLELSDDDRFKHASMLELIGTMQRTVGDLPAASDAYQRMEMLVQRQVERAPDKLDLQWQLAIAKGLVADVLYDQNDLDRALVKYGEARTILQALAAKDIDNVHWIQWMRDLAVNLNRTGDVGRAMGNYEAALKAYRFALQLTEQLVNLSPDAVLLRFDMAICHNKIGYALWLANDLDGALAAFEVSLSIDENLVSRYPDNADYQRHVTINLNWIGDLKRMTGAPIEQAFDAYERSRAITERLIARDPQNTLYRNDLAVSFTKIGDTKRAAGDLDGSLEAHRSSLAITEYLAELDASNAEWQRGLSIAHNRVGDILLAKGDAAAAGAEYQAAYTVAKALLDADPNNVQRIVDVAYSRYMLATAGIDRQANLTAARDALAALKADGRLPPAFERLVANVDTALKAVAP